ncbi:MAG: hypothetical protein WCP18_02330 [bacterium]
MFFFKTSNYDQSNKITSVKFSVSAEAILLTQKILASSEATHRQIFGEKLLDELSDSAKIDVIELKIIDDNQYHKKANGRVVMKRYGSYRPASKLISISNRTAVRGQTLAAKSFLDTLLHEWLHHYDTYKLKLRSIHSKGFYLRLNDLKEKLKV